MKPFINSSDGVPDWNKMKINVKKYDSLGEETFRIYRPIIVFKYNIEPALKRDPDWNKILAIIKKQNAGKGEEFLVGSSVVFYLNSGLNLPGTSNDFKNFMASATYYFKHYYSYLTADPLNTWAWTVFQKSSDSQELTRALVWSDSCLKLSPKSDARLF